MARDDGGRSMTVDVARISITDISPPEFEERFLRRNEPCILTGVGRDWPACKEWVAGGLPALDALEQRFGGETVSVHDCGASVLGRYRISEMRLAELLALWSNGKGASLYLKDWNLALGAPSTEFYATPPHFARDWLNGHAHATGQASDHRFVYIGRGGTFTPLHKDVLCSYSWSFNVAGAKRWWLVCPEDEPRLRAARGQGALAHDLRSIDAAALPDWDEGARARVLHVLQQPGEALFVPSCWVHQVLNEGGPSETVLSINHNWLNGFCAPRCWDFLQQQRAEIVRTVAGCEDDEQTVQDVLEFKFSFNYHGWHELLCCALESATARAQAALHGAADARRANAPAEARALRAALRGASEELRVALSHLELVSRTGALLDAASEGTAPADDEQAGVAADTRARRVRELAVACEGALEQLVDPDSGGLWFYSSRV